MGIIIGIAIIGIDIIGIMPGIIMLPGIIMFIGIMPGIIMPPGIIEGATFGIIVPIGIEGIAAIVVIAPLMRSLLRCSVNADVRRLQEMKASVWGSGGFFPPT